MKPIAYIFNRRLWLGVLSVIFVTSIAMADIKDTAKATFAKTKEAVINISAVIKIEIPGRGSKGQEVETTGTVISDDGMVVVSAASINPVEAVLEAAGENAGTKPKVQLTEIKYRLADGTEIHGRLVYKDKDLDVAFLVPDLKTGETVPKFTSIEVKEGPKVHELDDVISVGRLSTSMSHAPTIVIGQILATISKPRTVYDYAAIGDPSTGTPIFTATGELLGFSMIHHEDGGVKAAKLRAMISGQSGDIIILPAGEVAGLMDSARKAAAKKETKPDAEDKPAKESADQSK